MNLGKTVIGGVGRRDRGLDMMKITKKIDSSFMDQHLEDAIHSERVFFLLSAIYGRALQTHPEVSLLDECTASQRGRKV